MHIEQIHPDTDYSHWHKPYAVPKGLKEAPFEDIYNHNFLLRTSKDIDRGDLNRAIATVIGVDQATQKLHEETRGMFETIYTRAQLEKAARKFQEVATGQVRDMVAEEGKAVIVAPKMAGLVPLHDVLTGLSQHPEVARQTTVLPLALKGGREDMVHRQTLLNHGSRLMIDDGMGTLTTQGRFLGIMSPEKAQVYSEAGDRIKRRKEEKGTFNIFTTGGEPQGGVSINGHLEDYQLIIDGLEENQTPVLTATKRNNGFVSTMEMRNMQRPETLWSRRQTAELDNTMSLVIPEDRVIVGGSPEDFPYRDWGLRPSELPDYEIEKLHASTRQALENAGLWTAEFRLLATLPDLLSLKTPGESLVTQIFISNLNTQFG